MRWSGFHALPSVRRLAVLLFLSLLTSAQPALANGGGEGNSGPAPMTFVSNIGKTGRGGGAVLQVQMVLVPAKPDAAKLIESFKPMLQHRVLLVLCGMSLETLRGPNGHKELAEILLEELNLDLQTSDKDGIQEIYFTGFIIQQN